MVHKKEFYFVRHGQTDHNIFKRVVHEDIPLNATGVRQAENIEEIISALPVKSVCFSPLSRAKKTKEIITPRLKAKQFEMGGLIECSMQVWPKMAQCPETDNEEVRDFMDRARKGVNEALLQEGPVLIIAHGGIHFAICYYMGITGYDWVIDNCVPVHFTVENGLWKAKKLK